MVAGLGVEEKAGVVSTIIAPENAHVLIHRACGMLPLWQMDFVHMITLRTFRWETSPGLRSI